MVTSRIFTWYVIISIFAEILTQTFESQEESIYQFLRQCLLSTKKFIIYPDVA
jgi:hypothetical protein